MNRKILAISNHADMLGGGEHSFLDLLSRLKVHWEILAVVPQEGELKIRLKKEGIETHVAPLPPLRPWHLCSILLSLKTYFILCRKYCPALVYANGSRAAFYGGLVGRILGFPVIWHCRIVDTDPYLDPILTRSSYKIIANSRATAKRFKKPLQRKVTVIHNGIDINGLKDLSVLKPALIENSWKVILVVARVSRWKRHDLALTAFEQIADREPHAHLVCVGSSDRLEPEWWNHLQEITRQSKYSDRIHWVGQISDVRPWYRSASVLLLCSENEPFGRVIVEAMACGIPVVATRSGGVPEIVRDGKDGFLVTPGSVDKMASRILEILTKNGLSRRLSNFALERAESFDLDILVDKMTNIFERTIKT